MKRMLQFGSGPPTGPEIPDLGDLGDLGGFEAEDADWDNLNFDWLSKDEDDEQDAFQITTTNAPEHQTQVFSRSVTLFIRLRKNESSPAAVSDLGINSLWNLASDDLSVFVGIIAGVVVLLLLVVMISIYTCIHKKNAHKEYSEYTYKHYSVKSEASSCTSARSPPSISKDSLVVVTTSSTVPQARLIAELDSPTNYFLEYECYCPPSNHDLCECNPGNINNNSFSYEENLSTPPSDRMRTTISSGSLKHSLSLNFDCHSKKSVEKESIDGCHTFPRGSLLSPTNVRTPILSLRVDATKHDSNKNYNISSNNNNNNNNNEAITNDVEENKAQVSTVDKLMTDTVRRSSSNLEQLTASSSALDSSGKISDSIRSSPEVIDDTFRTRSLPAWVRSKNRPLATLEDLNTIYEKEPRWSKRRRNRMRSDAAQVIALSKSRGRLLSPGSASSNASSINEPPPAPPQIIAPIKQTTDADTQALLRDQAVIVYNERTAL